jgi:hypothetical protein
VSINMTDRFSSAKCYHLVKPSDVDHHRGDGVDRGSKMVSEIYLTRLLATKVRKGVVDGGDRGGRGRVRVRDRVERER